MQTLAKQLLKLTLLLLSISAATASSETKGASSIGSTFKKFLFWPIDTLSSESTAPKEPVQNGPLLSQKLFRTLYDSTPNTEYKDDALFSFKVTGSAARKHRELNGYGVNFYDGPYPGDELHSTEHEGEHAEAHGAHDDVHDLVVHVTYEDICEYTTVT